MTGLHKNVSRFCYKHLREEKAENRHYDMVRRDGAVYCQVCDGRGGSLYVPQRIVFAEFGSNGKPYALVVERRNPYSWKVAYEDIACDWSECEGELYCHESGSSEKPPFTISPFADGSPSRYWVAEGFGVKSKGPLEQLGDEWMAEWSPDGMEWPLMSLYDRIVDAGESAVYCGVCKDYMHEDTAHYSHRHLWENDDYEWKGTGAYDPRDAERTRDSLFLIFERTGMAESLAATIRAGRMGFDAIHFSGSMFGYDSVNIWFVDQTADYGHLLLDGMKDDDEDRMTHGVMWLVGLDNDKTPGANDLTLGWIAEYQAQAVTA